MERKKNVLIIIEKLTLFFEHPCFGTFILRNAFSYRKISNLKFNSFYQLEIGQSTLCSKYKTDH